MTLAWDPSPDGAVVGYFLHEGSVSGAYTNVTDVRSATRLTVSNLVNGATYFFAVTAYGANGQESEFSNEVSYTVPSPTNNPPTVALTLPADGAVYTAPGAINFAADVEPNGHAVGQVEFYNGATLLGASTTPPYSFSWNNVSAGTYSLSAQAVYDSGSTVASAPVNVTVAAGWPPTGLTFATDLGTIGLPSSATLTWDPSPDIAIAGYHLYEGVASGTYTNLLDVGHVTVATVSNLVNGVTYFFVVTAYDTNGTESGFSDEVSYTVPLPSTSPPKVVMTLPLNGAVYSPPATINFAARVFASGHTINQVQFYNGAALLGVSTLPPYGFSWQNVGVGTYSLSTWVVYDSGRVATSAVATVTVAIPPPSGLTFAADPGMIGFAFSGTLAWTPSPGPAIAGYSVYEGVSSGIYTNTIDVGNVTSATVSNLVNGVTYFFAVTAYGPDRQESGFSDEVSYTVPWPTNSPPDVSMTLPVRGAVYVAPATINFAASVTPNGHAISEVHFHSGATLLGICASAPYILSWQNVGAGTYSLSAQVVYDSGSTAASLPCDVTVASRTLGSSNHQPEQ